ncbi:hypothetical protein M2451_001690 [Dysgonomonas sp. PFB1-18]|uniref:hypothetical protein n=1 Tax=unclassified Dysgonomonas TaxID=2630389 RepID=UPI002474AD24|nr:MULTISPECIES: hypothetical protein [unclassified Dysgonomonas]MDL2303486.1 hypothetical protein [Dysgonomonas sp. OttesenSCG-928-D17]MDH6309119.1 hypothetical protein [Dysgonomonas sp. PF1-14]MDH6339001.1 hypothetical protein [Dysgonomonas sp. PF1-16]MDH6380368.1 hypothetical protein [Dysgonomonas sp. PFB1-18]MDH6397829.1 hypothetical protein [Dysgonomonas sp. PF1-23]
MEDLIKKLQDEAGLTQDQAIKSVSVVKDYMDKEGLDIDWEKFFKGKSEDFLDKARGLFSNVSKQTQSYTDKLVDKVDDFADKARKGAHDLSQKAADFFDER